MLYCGSGGVPVADFVSAPRKVLDLGDNYLESFQWVFSRFHGENVQSLGCVMLVVSKSLETSVK